jgi:hypothetical protein
MQTRFKFKTGILALLVLLAVGLTSCEEDIDMPGTAMDGGLLAAGRVGGTWAKPTNIVTPTGVPAEVFGAMRLVFTTDQTGQPAKFLAQDCPIIFETKEGDWTITGNEANATIKLAGIAPVDEFYARVSSNNLILNFKMGWENTETGATGEGDFSVTLSRQ